MIFQIGGTMHITPIRPKRAHGVYANRSQQSKKKKNAKAQTNKNANNQYFFTKFSNIMKVFTTLFASMLLTVLAYSQPCSDIFISEIVYGEQGTSLTGVGNAEFPIKNFSVELFNPTDASINLANYKIELFTEDAVSASTTITLAGTVAAKETFVVSNPNSTTDVTNLSDQLSPGLDFDNNVVLQITKNGNVIDVVGQQGIGDVVGDINLDSLLNDPTYLENLNINLRSIENLVVRRRPTVQEGKTVFETATLIDEWWIYPNNFIDNLGEHLNACMVAVLKWKDYNFFEPEITVTEGGFSGTLEGTIAVTGALDANIKVYLAETFHEFTSTNANAADFNDYNFDVFNEYTIPASSNNNSEKEVDICSITNDTQVEGPEGAGFWLIMLDDNGTGAYVDPGASIFDILINDDETSSTSNVYTQSKYIRAYPTVTSGLTLIETTEPNHLLEEIKIFSSDGKIVKQYELDKIPSVQVDLSGAPNGYLYILIKSNRGLAIKQVIKQ